MDTDKGLQRKIMKTAKDDGGDMGGELEGCIEDYTTTLFGERLGRLQCKKVGW